MASADVVGTPVKSIDLSVKITCVVCKYRFFPGDYAYGDDDRKVKQIAHQTCLDTTPRAKLGKNFKKGRIEPGKETEQSGKIRFVFDSKKFK